MNRHSPRTLRENRGGIALVEFALLLPVMLMLFLGGFQLSQASACQRRVTVTARAISDLVSQYETITPAQITTILNASTQIMVPYDVKAAHTRVSLIAIDKDLKVTVIWSEAKNATERSPGDFTGLPAAMKIANSYYILGEVTYDYSPMKGRFAWPVTFTQSLFMVPRKSTYVDCPSC